MRLPGASDDKKIHFELKDRDTLLISQQTRKGVSHHRAGPLILYLPFFHA